MMAVLKEERVADRNILEEITKFPNLMKIIMTPKHKNYEENYTREYDN